MSLATLATIKLEIMPYQTGTQPLWCIIRLDGMHTAWYRGDNMWTAYRWDACLFSTHEAALNTLKRLNERTES